jgi:hypothetical protein
VATYRKIRPGEYRLGPGAISQAGRPSTITPRGALGYIESFDRGRRMSYVNGWAATVDHRPVGTVVAFLANRLAGATVPFLERPDLDRQWDLDGGARLGFSISVPGALSAAAARSLRVYALIDGKATPLKAIGE